MRVLATVFALAATAPPAFHLPAPAIVHLPHAAVQGSRTTSSVENLVGQVSRARIIKSLDPYFGLDTSALEAAKKWRLAPATRDGRPVGCLVTIEMHFVLAR